MPQSPVPFILLAILCLGGCGESDDSPAGAAPVAANVILLPESFYAGVAGGNRISGTVTLPASKPAGTRLRVTLSSGLYSFSATGVMSATGTTATYLIDGIAAGTYQISVQVDVSGSGAFTDIGDYSGAPAGPPAGQVTVPTAGAVNFSLTVIAAAPNAPG